MRIISKPSNYNNNESHRKASNYRNECFALCRQIKHCALAISVTECLPKCTAAWQPGHKTNPHTTHIYSCNSPTQGMSKCDVNYTLDIQQHEINEDMRLPEWLGGYDMMLYGMDWRGPQVERQIIDGPLYGDPRVKQTGFALDNINSPL